MALHLNPFQIIFPEKKTEYNCYVNGTKGHVPVYDLFNEGFDSLKVKKLEKVTTEEALKDRKRHYIESFKCVNKVIIGRTDKEYRQQPRTEIREYKKQYHEANKDNEDYQDKKAAYNRNYRQRKYQELGVGDTHDERLCYWYHEPQLKKRAVPIKCKFCSYNGTWSKAMFEEHTRNKTEHENQALINSIFS